MEGRRVNVVLSPVSVKNKINKIVNNVPSKESDEGKEADKE
jgi:hypothetical protein